MYPKSMFEQNKKNINNFHQKIIIFTAVKYHSILHRRVCVMRCVLCNIKLNNIRESSNVFYRGKRKSKVAKNCCI